MMGEALSLRSRGKFSKKEEFKKRFQKISPGMVFLEKNLTYKAEKGTLWYFSRGTRVTDGEFLGAW